MNKHTKTAILVAPILTILGFALADLWEESEAQQERAFELVPFGHCDVSNQKCILKSGEFEINVMDDKGITTVNSTFPIDTATLFVINKENKATPYPLGMKDSPYYWKRETPLGTLVSNKGDSAKLRVIIEIKGGKYFAEFYTQTTK
jgi:hypothetical protein